jgi:hypothetical protein
MGQQERDTWLKARHQLQDAEQRLLAMLGNAQMIAIALREWRSKQPSNAPRQYGAKELFQVNSWPEPKLVNDTLIECHEAEVAFKQAGAALSAEDRVLLQVK